ncbi:hypothetical protein FOPE_10066 [Fonsecaea pedrosoi]|nr:hypothetical protein FOPE_10066 [Fonsecaea pedrosoi]
MGLQIKTAFTEFPPRQARVRDEDGDTENNALRRSDSLVVRGPVEGHTTMIKTRRMCKLGAGRKTSPDTVDLG